MLVKGNSFYINFLISHCNSSYWCASGFLYSLSMHIINCCNYEKVNNGVP